MPLITTKPVTLVNGEKSLLPDTEFVSGTGFLDYVTTAVQTNTTTTYTNVTELTTGSLPIGLYTFKVVAICQSSASPTGIGVRVSNASATLTTCLAKWMISNGNNGTGQSYQYDQLTTTTNLTATASPIANTDFVTIGHGVFRVTAAGTVAIQIRSETGNAVSIRPNSVFQIKRVA